MYRKAKLLAATAMFLVPAASYSQERSAGDPAAQRATPNEPASEQSEIVVVGSRIEGSSVAAALPVTVVGEDEIVASGATDGDELFRSIPQLGDVDFNSNTNPGSSNSARGDVGSVNLRNLGIGKSLVLLNGRRVVNHPTSQADDNLSPVLTVNTNTIPTYGIERLEILRDGAAAIYGSDAIAGVINTVLRKKFRGVELESQVGWGEDTSLLGTSTHLLAGVDLGARGNLTVFANYDSRKGVRAADTPYTASIDRRSLFDGTRFEGVTSLDGRGSITPWGQFRTLNNVPVRLTRAGTPLVTNSSGQFHIQPTANGGCSLAITSELCIDDGVNTNAADRNLRWDPRRAFNTNITNDYNRINVFANGNYQLTDGLEFFGEAGLYYANTKNQQGAPGTLTSVPLTIAASAYYNPFGPTGSPNRLAGTNVPAAGLPVRLDSYLFADTGSSLVEVQNSQFRVLAGVRFEALGLRWESAAVYSEARVRDRADGISQTLLQRQINLTTPDAYNPFNGGDLASPSLGDAAPSSQAAIDAIKVKTNRVDKATLAMWDIKGSTNQLFRLPAGNVGLAIGAEIRRDTQSDDRDPRVDGTIKFTDSVTGIQYDSDLVGTSSTPDAKGSRVVAAAYLELAVPVISPEMRVPLIRNLELQLAGRFENYSDIGSVAKPKIAAAWDVIPEFRLRGSYSESFMAPNLEQVNVTEVARSNSFTDYVRCEAQIRKGIIASFANCSQGFVMTALRAGNPNLKPETAKTWSAGFVMRPSFLDDTLGRITFTADYWHVSQKGIIGVFGEVNSLITDYMMRAQGQSNPNVIREAPTADDIALFSGSGLDPAGRALFINDQYVNLLPQKVAGLDMGLNWRLPDFGIGRFTLAANAAYLNKFYLEPSPQVQTLIAAREAGTINPSITFPEAGDLTRRNGKPRWKVTGTVTWAYKQFQIGAYTQYTGDVEGTSPVDAAGVPWLIEDQMTYNLYGQITVGRREDARVRLRIGVRNLTNEAPPLSSSGWLSKMYNPYGRYWYSNVRVSF